MQVLDDDPPGSGNAGQTHHLKAERRQESYHEGGSAWVLLSPQDAADTTRGKMEVTARIWVPSTNRDRVDIDAYDEPPSVFMRRAFHVRFHPNGDVSYYKDQENVIPELKIELDAWQDVFIRADLAVATFDLTVGLPVRLAPDVD